MRRLAAALALILLPAGLAAAPALAPAPFAAGAEPGTIREGGSLTLRLAPRAGGAAGGDELADVYVAVNQHRRFVWAYYTPGASWSARPEPYRRGVTLGSLAPLEIPLHRVHPAGWYTFRLHFVRAGAEGPSRRHYVRQPLEVVVRVDPAPAATGGPAPIVLGLTALTLVAWAVVLWWPAGRRPGPG